MKKLSKFLIIFAVFLGSFLTPLQVIFTPQGNTTESTNKFTFKNIDIVPLEAYALNGPEKGTSNDYFVCSWYELHCWVMDLIYVIAVPVGNALVAVAGMVLDFFMLHSISSTSYRSGFIEAGWEILRDVTNIFFLFALLILAFQMVLGMGNAKKSLINIILVALTINFSLFMSYLIVDTSNIFAHVFYNKITAPEINQQDGGTATVSEFIVTGEESRSLAIADKIDPQKLTNILPVDSSRVVKLVVVLVAGMINYALISVFLGVALLMLGRTVGLFITVVLAPLAFASIIMPKMQDIPYVGFKNWIKDLMKLAFLAPVFLFFLYLTVQFINIGLPGSESTGELFTQLLNVLIPMMAVLVLIKLSKRVATDMAGKIGGMVAETVSKAVSTIGKVTLGAAAIGATVGLGAVSVGAKGLGAATGSTKLKTFGKIAGSTKFDLTKMPGFKQLAGDKVTKFAGGISGKSARGNIEDGRKWWRESGTLGFKNTAEEDDAKANKRKQAKAQKLSDRDEYNDGSKFGGKTKASEVKAKEAHEKWQEDANLGRAEREGQRARGEAESELEQELNQAQSEAANKELKPNQRKEFEETISQLEEINKNIEKLDKEASEQNFNKNTDQDILKTQQDGLRKIEEKIGKEPTIPSEGFKNKNQENTYNKQHKEWEEKRNQYTSEIKSYEEIIQEKETAINDSNTRLTEIRSKKEDFRKQTEGIKDQQKNIAKDYIKATIKVKDIKKKIEEIGSKAEQGARQNYAGKVAETSPGTANAIRDGKKPTGAIEDELHKLVEEMKKNKTDE